MVHIKDLPLPLRFDEVAQRLFQAGYKTPTAFVSRWQCHAITVTNGPSGRAPDGAWQANVDQPLLHFYHKVFLTSNGEEKSPPYVSEAELAEAGNDALISALKIRFHRCVATGLFAIRVIRCS
ncbi:hypothetical protein BS17DRAFT_528292 [Gyrodon lividus]|nr:hypothetical protein BS17DRAFT_528292 [Gyrodon lividus]